jgi:membrane protease YdiL (CAAX protease family)
MRAMPQTSLKHTSLPLITAAGWAAVIAVSTLPDILFKELGGGLPGWLYWAKVGLLAVLLLASLAWGRLHPLRLFFAAALSLYIVQYGVGVIYDRLGYRAWFAGSTPFMTEMLSVQIPRFTIGALMVMILLVLTRDPKRFFFVAGNREAIAAPIPLLMDRPTPWKKLGPFLCGCFLLGMIVIVWLMGTHPSLAHLAQAAPLLPLILIFAASNAFGEEMSYRAALLAGLEPAMGYNQALVASAVYFGLAHFYGVPYGVAGVLLSTFMGWMLGKSMLETRGFFWPWIIHVCLDVVVFAFIAVGSVTAGG